MNQDMTCLISQLLFAFVKYLTSELVMTYFSLRSADLREI